MTLDEIDAQIKRKNELSLEEKEALAKGMMENPEARKIMIEGALMLGDYALATELMFYTSNTETNAV